MFLIVFVYNFSFNQEHSKIQKEKGLTVIASMTQMDQKPIRKIERLIYRTNRSVEYWNWTRIFYGIVDHGNPLIEGCIIGANFVFYETWIEQGQTITILITLHLSFDRTVY